MKKSTLQQGCPICNGKKVCGRKRLFCRHSRLYLKMPHTQWRAGCCLVPRMCAAHPCLAGFSGTRVASSASVTGSIGGRTIAGQARMSPAGPAHIRGTRLYRTTFMCSVVAEGSCQFAGMTREAIAHVRHNREVFIRRSCITTAKHNQSAIFSAFGSLCTGGRSKSFL